MSWSDNIPKAMELEGTAIILEAQEYLNDLLIMSVLFEQHGIRKGAIKSSKTNKTALTVGNILHLRWYARLENHLGNFNIKSFEFSSFHTVFLILSFQ